MVSSEPSLRRWIEALPPDLLKSQRWYAAKGEAAASLEARDVVYLRQGPPAWVLSLVDVVLDDGRRQCYQIPLVVSHEGWAGASPGTTADSAPATNSVVDPVASGAQRDRRRLKVRLRVAGRSLYMWEPSPLDGFWQEVLRALREGREVGGERGRVCFRPTSALTELTAERTSEAISKDVSGVRSLESDQSNSSVVYSDSLILKTYRRVQEGSNPEVEICRLLSEKGRSRVVPLVAGDYYFVDGAGNRHSLGLLQEFLPGSTDGWTLLLRALREILEGGVSPFAERVGARLGGATAELHLALASLSSEEEFCPETFLPEDVSAFKMKALDLLEEGSLRSGTLKSGADVQRRVQDLLGRLQAKRPAGLRIRVHGDYHLGQVLFAGDRISIVDFEGEPARPLSERRSKHSPLRDVAGMLRSFNYAVHVASGRPAGPLEAPGCVPSTPERSAEARALLSAWEAGARQQFLDRYLALVRGAAPQLLPPAPACGELLAAFELEKALYEVVYEAQNRPELLWIPLSGIETILERVERGRQGRH